VLFATQVASAARDAGHREVVLIYRQCLRVQTRMLVSCLLSTVAAAQNKDNFFWPRKKQHPGTQLLFLREASRRKSSLECERRRGPSFLNTVFQEISKCFFQD
jgi:hypothetical protein